MTPLGRGELREVQLSASPVPMDMLGWLEQIALWRAPAWVGIQFVLAQAAGTTLGVPRAPVQPRRSQVSWYHATALLTPHSNSDGMGHPCPNSLTQPWSCPLPTFTPLLQQPCGAAGLAPPARIRNFSANLELCKIAAISASTFTTSPSWGQRNGHRSGVLDMCPRGLQPPSQMIGRVKGGACLGPKSEETPTKPKHQTSNHSGSHHRHPTSPLPQSNACICLPFLDICTPPGLHSPLAPPPPKLAPQITEDPAE